jgi:hypothetical protein
LIVPVTFFVNGRGIIGCPFRLAWESAVKTLKSASEPEIPLTLELKERAGHDAPSVAEQLNHAAAVLHPFEREWS